MVYIAINVENKAWNLSLCLILQISSTYPVLDLGTRCINCKDVVFVNSPHWQTLKAVRAHIQSIIKNENFQNNK